METKQLPLRQIGIIAAIGILLVLILMNYETIYRKLASWIPSTEGFQGTGSTGTPVVSSANYEPVGELTVDIRPEDKTVKVTFDDVTPNSATNPIRSGYLIVLSKYNNELKQVDAINVKVSKEGTQGTTTTSPLTTATSAGGASVQLSGICNSDNICSYTFTNVQSNDEGGKPYYYRLGVGVIYTTATDEEISNIVPYTFGPGGRQTYFRVDVSQQEQEKLIQQLEELQKAKIVKPDTAEQAVPSPSEVPVDMEAYMRMLRPYIGNYPDEFTLTKNDLKDLTLDKYLSQSMALGQFNINVDIADLQTKTTSAPKTL